MTRSPSGRTSGRRTWLRRTSSATRPRISRGSVGETVSSARSVAARLSHELESPLGQTVGYKVRFSDKLSENTYVKLMKGQGGLAVARDERGRRKMALNGNGATPLPT